MFKSERVGFITLGAGLILFLAALLARNCSRMPSAPTPTNVALVDSVGMNTDSIMSEADTITAPGDSVTQKTKKKRRIKRKTKTTTTAKPLVRSHRDEPAD